MGGVTFTCVTSPAAPPLGVLPPKRQGRMNQPELETPYPRTPAPAVIRIRIRTTIIRIPTTGTAIRAITPRTTGDKR